MKHAMWSVSPEGSFAASERDNPNQLVLLNAEPDLTAFRNKMIGQFKGKSLYMNDMYEWLRGEIYIEKHLHKVLRECRDQGLLSFQDYDGRFAFDKNPLVVFS